MAKVKTKKIDSTNFSLEVDLNTKNTTYEFGKGIGQTTLSFDIKPLDAYNTTSYFIKDGNDLKYVAMYQDKNNYAVAKTIITTILNFYDHSEEYSDIVKKGNSVVTEYYNAISGTTHISTVGEYYAGSNKADKVFLQGGGNRVRDLKGNDKYNFSTWANPVDRNYVYDYAGNDKYTISILPKTTIEGEKYGGQTKATIYDYSGNDTYTVKDTRKSSDVEGGAAVTIGDYNGKDKYNMNGVTSANISDYNKNNDVYNISNSATVKAYDWDGNETYNISTSTDVSICDYGGNDKYNVSNSKVVIRENLTDGASPQQKGTAGNETYTLNGLYADSRVYDMLGNDKYTINYAQGTNANKVNITDSDGKDSYKISGSKYVDVNDLLGNDSYSIYDSSNIVIHEHKDVYDPADETNYQNESYTIKNSSSIQVIDGFGNDTFNINLSLNTITTDWSGTDKYTITNSNNTTLYDNYNTSTGSVMSYDDGSDTFIVKDSIETVIWSGKGDDKFSISDDAMRTTIVEKEGNEVYTAKETSTLKIRDEKGDDSYKFTSVDNVSLSVAHTDTESGALDYNIKDDDGNDKYDVKNSRFVYIIDNTKSDNEKNTYNVTSSENTYIYSDRTGSKYSTDTYNITSGKNTKIEDYGTFDDIYNIKKFDKKSSVFMTDKGGNDTYTLDKLNGKISISDEGGDKDILSITGSKASDIVFMADAETDGGRLFAYNKNTGGILVINGYYDFSNSGDEYHLTGYGEGQIETIKLGKKDAGIYNAAVMDTYQQEVTAFLTTGENAYGTIENALNSGDKNAINELIAYFTAQG